MIPFVREIEFEYGRCDQVSPLIRRVIADNPGPFTYVGTGTYIVGRGTVAVIDPGPDLDGHLQALLAALEGERVSHILVTHHHSDHSPLARPLQKATGATIHGRRAPHLAELAPGLALEAGEDEGFRPDVEIADGDVLRRSGLDPAGRDHAGPHLQPRLLRPEGGERPVLRRPCHGLVDHGDHPARRRHGRLFRQPREGEGPGFDTLWPTHGAPVRDVAPFIQAYADHRRGREAQVLGALAQGPTTIKAMVPTLYAAVDPRLHPAAAMSVLAHLLLLVKAGRVTCDGEPGLDSLYRLA
jgi:hypothetical protein